MKKGDKIKMSERNPNHLNNGVDAYAGMEGIVIDVYDDGAFVLDCGTSILVVPMNDAWKRPKKGVWVWLNGEHIFHKRIDTKPTRNKKILKIIRNKFGRLFFLFYLCNNKKKNKAMKFITSLFRLSARVHILITLIVFIAWLFDSTPTNLLIVWTYSANTLIILFLINLIFGKKFL